VAPRRSLYGLDGLNFFTASMQAGFGSFVVIHLVANHWPAQAIGFALTISAVSSLISQVPAGAFIDSIDDKRRAVRLGAMGVGVAALLLGLSSAKPVVYLAQALQGLGSSLIAPGIAAISLARVGDAAFSERVGRNARFASIGNGLTAGVMGLAGSYFAPASIFFVAAALTVPTLLSLSLVGSTQADGRIEDPARKKAHKQDDHKLTWKAVQVLLRDQRLLIFALCVVLFFASSAAMPAGVAAQVTRRRPELATLNRGDDDAFAAGDCGHDIAVDWTHGRAFRTSADVATRVGAAAVAGLALCHSTRPVRAAAPPGVERSERRRVRRHDDAGGG
jgi:hypothetical protein